MWRTLPSQHSYLKHVQSRLPLSSSHPILLTHPLHPTLIHPFTQQTSPTPSPAPLIPPSHLTLPIPHPTLTQVKGLSLLWLVTHANITQCTYSQEEGSFTRQARPHYSREPTNARGHIMPCSSMTCHSVPAQDAFLNTSCNESLQQLGTVAMARAPTSPVVYTQVWPHRVVEEAVIILL